MSDIKATCGVAPATPLKVTKNMERLIQVYSELLEITKSKKGNFVYYCENIFRDPHFVLAVSWIYKYFLDTPVTIFVPTNYTFDIHSFKERFSIELDVSIGTIDLQTLEEYQLKKGLVLFYLGDMIFDEIPNKKRLSTLLKKINQYNKVIVFQSSLLTFEYFETFEKIKLSNPNELITWKNMLDYTSYIDFLDQDVYTSLLELLKTKKRVYLSVDLSLPKILELEKEIKQAGIPISRKETGSDGVVINVISTTQKTFLKYNYDTFIFLFKELQCNLLRICKDTLKCVSEPEIYFDGSCDAEELFQDLFDVKSKINVKDSMDFKNYSDIPVEGIVVTESYYVFDLPENDLNFRNLSKKEYDFIRNYVKTHLKTKYDITVKTCQLATPSSPKDRSRKLNSLSNKMNDNYICEVTCELFKNGKIGVILWSELFSTKSPILKNLKNETFIYQTTYGSWKYTTFE